MKKKTYFKPLEFTIAVALVIALKAPLIRLMDYWSLEPEDFYAPIAFIVIYEWLMFLRPKLTRLLKSDKGTFNESQ